jgi:hypothetical protein
MGFSDLYFFASAMYPSVVNLGLLEEEEEEEDSCTAKRVDPSSLHSIALVLHQT